MSSLNRVIVMGNLTRDVEVRYIPSGSAVAELGLALNRSWFDTKSKERKEEVTFVDVTVWGTQAENAAKYLAKGRSVLVEGRLHLEQWDDKQSGQKRSKLKVIAENVQFIGGGKADGERQPPGEKQPPMSRPEAERPAQQPAAERPAAGGGDDEVPF